MKPGGENFTMRIFDKLCDKMAILYATLYKLCNEHCTLTSRVFYVAYVVFVDVLTRRILGTIIKMITSTQKYLSHYKHTKNVKHCRICHLFHFLSKTVFYEK